MGAINVIGGKVLVCDSDPADGPSPVRLDCCDTTPPTGCPECNVVTGTLADVMRLTIFYEGASAVIAHSGSVTPPCPRTGSPTVFPLTDCVKCQVPSLPTQATAPIPEGECDSDPCCLCAEQRTWLAGFQATILFDRISDCVWYGRSFDYLDCEIASMGEPGPDDSCEDSGKCRFTWRQEAHVPSFQEVPFSGLRAELTGPPPGRWRFRDVAGLATSRFVEFSVDLTTETSCGPFRYGIDPDAPITGGGGTTPCGVGQSLSLPGIPKLVGAPGDGSIGTIEFEDQQIFTNPFGALSCQNRIFKLSGYADWTAAS